MTDAEVVVLKKFRHLAPDFHRHMLPGKLEGKLIQVGDRVLVYEVDETVPSGKVTVTPRTRLEVR